MKKILLLLFLMTISLGQSQGLSQGFETGGIGGIFASSGLPTVTREAGTGTNTTQVLKFVGNTGSALWQGVNIPLTTNVNLTPATTRTMTIDVYASGPLFFLVKVNGGISGAQEAAAVVEYTGTNTWQTCSFTFNSVRDGKAPEANGTYTNFVLHPYWPSATATTFPAGNATARTLYVDNIVGPLALPSATVGAFTIPTKSQGDATFTITPPTSNNTSPFTYTSNNNSVGTIVNGNQIQVGSLGSATITAAQVSDGTFASTSTTASFNVVPPAAPIPPARNSFDVVSLYSDSYTPTAGATWQAGTNVIIDGNNTRLFNGFTLARLAFAARSISAMTTLHIDVYTVNQNQLWFEINGNRKVVSSIPLNGWVSFDIPLSDYVGLNLGNVSFFDLNNPTGAAAPVKVVYLDNIYFYRPATDAPPTIGALTVPTPQTVGNAPFVLTNPTSNSSGAFTYSASPAGVVTISGNTVTIIGGGTTTITATQAAVPGVFGAGSVSAPLVVNFQAPTVAAPTPTVPSANVISHYSNAYTPNVATNLNPNWGQQGFGSANVSSFTVAGNSTLFYPNFNYQGNALSTQNLTSYTSMHLDIWTPNVSFLRISLIRAAGGGERPVTIPVTPNTWNSVDILLTDWSSQGGFSLANIAEIKYENVASLTAPSWTAGGVLYLDNIYFSNVPLTINPTISGFTIPTKAPGDATFTITPPTSNSPGAWSYTSSDDTIGTIVNGNEIQVGVAGSCTITATQAAAPGYNSGSIAATFNVLLTPTITGFTVPAKVTSDAPFELTAPTSDSPGTFTYSILPAGIATISGSTVTILGPGTATITATQAAAGLFSSATTTAQLVVSLGTAAPTPPTRNAWDVVSLYSDSYASTAGATWQAGTNVDIAGNNTRLFNGFTLARLAFAPTSIAAMTTLHIDVYTVNQNQLWFEVQGNRRVESSIPLNGWVSFDIPLTVFTGLNLANISFFDLNNPTGAQAPVKVVYLDNIYFYRPATDQPPTIGALTLPTPQVLGNAPFTLTNPTSDSSGAWTYSANPTGVVTISGNTVTIVGGGTTTITATQAAVPGVFGPATTSATLVVNFPDPTPSPALPEREPGRVISLFTGTPSVYANAPNYNLGQAFWSEGGGRILTTVPNGDNTALRIDGLGFMGLIDIGNPPPVNRERRINLVETGMSHLNIDIYLDTPRPNLFVVLLAPGDRLHNTGPLAAGWNRLRIPLTAYPGALNDIYGLKIEQNYAAPFRLFIDNIYFSNDLFTFYADADGDGFGDLASTILAETAPEGYVTNSTDCDDTNELVWQIGDFYIDIDGDGYSFDGVVYPICYGATTPEFYNTTSLGIDCNDFDATVYRNTDFYADVDGDGYSATPSTIVTTVCYGAVLPEFPGLSPAINAQVDCNDTNPAINPGAAEICYDGLDNDCDGIIDNGCTPIVSVVLPNQCGVTLEFVNSYVYAALVPGAQGYRFRVTNTATNDVQTIDQLLRGFRFTQLTNYAFNTTYSVEVSVRINNVWQPFYGTPCTVSTPDTTTQVQASQCNTTLSNLNNSIIANIVPFATGYRFRITNTLNPIDVQTIDRPIRDFRMSSLSNIQFNTTYNVEVAVRNTDGTY
ncbi:putative metal-binding motif-containing protein, partial [Flavobacterium lacus]